ncbi:DUF2794 domain-containing protein [Notoacmeibacter sp. MSK16QG-6]|uniref:DUF2794 domain-containing protein n=1 Tax=Notoacmeibacter sp. MSK16QG-6 TaxID=2957982 RepID=UPI00209CCD85|nr:DUF2794 domain-containing protein [Notoacmeibacter sp. MSK16QG-6]MCP1199139.1 DUF2794 domain-containing protein [Notoacmeibacter sp. MSK16QG-6]
MSQPKPSGNLVDLGAHRRDRNGSVEPDITFHRSELERILNLYSFMVAAGEWRDYAIDFMTDCAVFSVYRRAREVPLYQIVKEPKRARRQGEWSVVTGEGQVLKRGHDLALVLRVFDRQLKIVRD